VPLQLILARTPSVLVALRRLVAYPDGVSFVLTVRCSPEETARRWLRRR
jgi:hypothetical protein